MDNTGIQIGESNLLGKPKKAQYPITKTKFVREGDETQEQINKRLWKALSEVLVAQNVLAISEDGYWIVDGQKTDFKAVGEKGEDGKTPLLRVSADGMSLEISTDGGDTWLPFIVDFNKLRVLGYVDSIAMLPKNANIGDIYGVWNQEAQEGAGAYELYIQTVKDWLLDYTITKVYDYDTELPSSATDGTAVLVPVTDLTLDKEKVDGYKVYKYSLANNGWVMVLNTAEIYANKEDIINYGDNVYALVQGATEGTYELYKRQTGWVYFGTNASITYVLVQDINEGTETNILSGKAVKNAYGHYIESPEFVRAYLDDEDKILWGIRTDGTVYFGAGVPPQVKDYIEERIGNYDDVITFLDDLEKGDKTLQDLLNEKVDKEKGKSLIDEEYAEGVHYIESPEYIEAKVDNEGKLLEAIEKDGTKLFAGDTKVLGSVNLNEVEVLGSVNLNGVECKVANNPEWLNVVLDAEDKIIWGTNVDGTIKTSSVSTDNLILSNEGLINFSDSFNSLLGELESRTYYQRMAIQSFGFATQSDWTTEDGYPEGHIPPLVFAHISDTHGSLESAVSAIKILNLISTGEINKGNCCQFLIHTGDIHWSNFLNDYSYWVKAINMTNIPTYICIGNHDAGNSKEISKCGSDNQIYDKMIAPLIDSWNLSTTSQGTPHIDGKNYYFKDLDVFKIRLIVLYEYEDEFYPPKDDMYYYRTRGARAISQEQLEWLIDSLETTPAGWGILIAKHQYENIVGNSENAFNSIYGRGKSYSGYLTDIGDMPQIVDAYINKNSISKSYSVDVGGGELKTITIEHDFSARPDSEFIAYISGHTHVDHISFLKDYPEQLELNIGCNNTYYTFGSDIAQIDNTLSEELMNVYSIDRNNGIISVGRIGANCTNYGISRNTIAIDYRNKNIVN